MDEERFPSLCAMPLVDGGRAVGALVVQRKQPRAFGQREIVLIASMAPPVLFALERARLRERERLAELAAAAPATPHARVHEVTLRGQPARARAVGCGDDRGAPPSSADARAADGALVAGRAGAARRRRWPKPPTR